MFHRRCFACDEVQHAVVLDACLYFLRTPLGKVSPHTVIQMYIPVPHSLVSDSSSSSTKTHFVLDGSAVAGILGGEEAVTSTTLVHVFEGGKWLGWYNSPGSYLMGKRFGLLAQSAIPILRKAVGDDAAKQQYYSQSNGSEPSELHHTSEGDGHFNAFSQIKPRFHFWSPGTREISKFKSI